MGRRKARVFTAEEAMAQQGVKTVSGLLKGRRLNRAQILGLRADLEKHKMSLAEARFKIHAHRKKRLRAWWQGQMFRRHSKKYERLKKEEKGFMESLK